LEPVRERRGLVLELGCGSGALTHHLVKAAHLVVATDASPAMLELARAAVPGVEELRLSSVPDEPLPECGAVVSVGHVLSYLPNEDAVEAALSAVATALRPGGVFAIDLLDLSYGGELAATRPEAASVMTGLWLSGYPAPSERLFVREITTFIQSDGG